MFNWPVPPEGLIFSSLDCSLLSLHRSQTLRDFPQINVNEGLNGVKASHEGDAEPFQVVAAPENFLR